MLSWLTANLGTIFVLIVLVVIVAAIVRKLYTDKKKGIHSCGGNCGACGACGHSCGSGCTSCAGGTHKTGKQS